MLIYDDIFRWEGFGGTLRLGNGKCRLRVYDLSKEQTGGLTYLRPFLVIVADVTDSKISVRSCAGHVATRVTQEFQIDPLRMLFIEHDKAKTYGVHNQHRIPERYEIAEFTWHQGRALHPKWRALEPPLLNVIEALTLLLHKKHDKV